MDCEPHRIVQTQKIASRLYLTLMPCRSVSSSDDAGPVRHPGAAFDDQYVRASGDGEALHHAPGAPHDHLRRPLRRRRRDDDLGRMMMVAEHPRQRLQAADHVGNHAGAFGSRDGHHEEVAVGGVGRLPAEAVALHVVDERGVIAGGGGGAGCYGVAGLVTAVGKAKGGQQVVDDAPDGRAQLRVPVAVHPGVERAAGQDGQGEVDGHPGGQDAGAEEHVQQHAELKQNGSVVELFPLPVFNSGFYQDMMEVIEEDRRNLEIGCTADYSFSKLHKLSSVNISHARGARLGCIPQRGERNNKFLTRCVWLNNNKLRSLQGLELFIESIMEYPDQTGWIDFSFNYITKIHDIIVKYPNLKILYLHGNCIEDLHEILKLRQLKQLKTVTFHGNPISNIPIYRDFVVAALPQVCTLDFTPITMQEKSSPPPAQFSKLFRAMK